MMGSFGFLMTPMLHNTSQIHDIDCTCHGCCLSDRIPHSFPQDPQRISAPIRWEWAEPVCVRKSPSWWYQSADSALHDLAAIRFFSSPLSSELILCSWQDGYYGYAFVTWGQWLPPWLGVFLSAVNSAFCVPCAPPVTLRAQSPGAEISPHSAANKDFSCDWTFWVWQQKDKWKANRHTK